MLTPLPFLSPRRYLRRLLGGAPAISISTDPQATRFLTLTRRTGIGYAIEDFSRACLINLIDFPEMPFRSNTVETVKAGGTALLIKTEFPVRSRMTAACYKRVRRRNWLKHLTASFRTNRLLRTWRLGHRLRELGVATPCPLAVIIPHRLHWGRESYLAIEWMEGAENLLVFARNLERLSPRRRRELGGSVSVEVGRLLGRMHGRQISHRDLKASNLLVRTSMNTASVEAWVIDLDGAEEHTQPLSQSHRVRNLSRLEVSLRRCPAVTPALRLRFLKSYLETLGDAAADWKEHWRLLAIASGERLAAKARKQRRTAKP